MSVVLVTGGARGIGLGIVTAFAAAGHKVMIGDLGGAPASEDWNYSLASSEDMADAARAQSAEVQATQLDVTDAESCAAAVATTIEQFGGLDILINNAGIVDSGPITDFSEAAWDKIFEVNTKGIFLMTRAALPALKSSDVAAVVNTASIAGKQGVPGMSAYCGSKFAAIGITQSLALELAPNDITVNAVCPGIVGTAMWLDHLMPSNFADDDGKQQNFEEVMAKRIPLGRPQTTEDIAEAVCYLATARNVTGIALTVAGGIQLN